ncbi:unnamed protein product [Clonostachys byssicola]|uniref:Major facilitator superfamily (MFS) profile domain-containing protein n=1 Tax=Clonostachys byssicola TaxID=160290 RepID=A0A9N9Y6K4_9HYPO|nr:unnamed protein product [Clonostachys byssicola]
MVQSPAAPDGGRRAWTQVAVGCLAVFLTWGYANAFGAFQSYYISVLPQNQSAISWIGSLQAWLTFSTGAISGWLLDAGYLTVALIAGAILQLLGIFLMSVSTQYWQLVLTQGILSGLGNGLIFTPTLALVLTYFSSRRSLALGLVTLGNSLGGVIYPAIVRGLLAHVGFSWMARTIGFIHLAGFCLVVGFLRGRLQPQQKGPVVDIAAFQNRVYVAYVLGLFFFCWARYYTFYYVGSFGIQVLHISYTEATYLIMIINGTGIPARIIVGLLADRFGPFNTSIPTGLCLTAVAFSWLGISNRVGIFAWTAFYGLFSAGIQSLIPSGVASISERMDMIGARLGMCFTVMSFAALSGPPIGGAIQNTAGGSYGAAQVWAGLADASCALLIILARVLQGRRKIEEKA